jgi:hypothetical protein
MAKKNGKYMFIGTPSCYGTPIKYSDALKDLKLSEYDKKDIKTGKSLLLVAVEDKINRIYSNGRLLYKEL